MARGAFEKSQSKCPQACVVELMNKNNDRPRGGRSLDYAAAAAEQMEEYCAVHPQSPSAVRRPQLFVRGDLWIALLGPSVEEGIVGIGSTVPTALRAFDSQYLAGLRPRNESIKSCVRHEKSPRTTALGLTAYF